jgi:hypothetical protein
LGFSYSFPGCRDNLVTNMEELFNKFSSYVCESEFFCMQAQMLGAPYRTGNAIVPSGEAVVLETGVYTCTDDEEDSENHCASTWCMLGVGGWFGEGKCIDDSASCVLDPKQSGRAIDVFYTFGKTVTLRSLTIRNGKYDMGGGLYVLRGGIVDVTLCVFSHCEATNPNHDFSGGGAVRVYNTGTTVNIYGTVFFNNTGGDEGDDIYNKPVPDFRGDITVHDSCPYPYYSKNATRGRF